MKKDDGDDGLTAFFFPKANPPVTIRAATREEAEEELKALKKTK